MVFEDFIQEKFVAPLCQYYTLEATIAYGVILVLAVVGIYNGLQKMNVRIDRYFFYGVIPFIIYGGWTRALRDHNLYQGWWFCSPPIYVVIAAIAGMAMVVGLYVQKKWKLPYWKFMAGVASVLILYNLTLTKITNPMGFFFV